LHVITDVVSGTTADKVSDPAIAIAAVEAGDDAAAPFGPVNTR
jgi:hypothetical protein